MKQNRYMVLLVDRKKARMFTIVNGSVREDETIVNGDVPQNVRANERDFYGRSDKIFRHIEDHLHRHLLLVSEKAKAFAEQTKPTYLLIGSHKPLFTKVRHHLPQTLVRKIKGTFVTELKEPFGDILKRVKRLIFTLEEHEKSRIVA